MGAEDGVAQLIFARNYTTRRVVATVICMSCKDGKQVVRLAQNPKRERICARWALLKVLSDLISVLFVCDRGEKSRTGILFGPRDRPAPPLDSAGTGPETQGQSSRTEGFCQRLLIFHPWFHANQLYLDTIYRMDIRAGVGVMNTATH